MADKKATLDLLLKLRDEASKEVAKTADALGKTDTAAQKAQTQLDQLATKYSLAARQSEILDKELTALNTKFPQGAIAVDKKKLALDKLNASMDQTAAKAQTLASAQKTEQASMDGTINSLKAMAGAYIGIQGAKQVLDWGKEGGAIQGVTQSFDNLTASAGKSASVLLNQMRAASNGTITDVKLMEGANKAMLLGGERLASALPKLLQIAQASAKATGQDVQFVFDSLVTGLARGSKQIIDNAGITVNAEAANKAYADSIGKTVAQLTDAEKAQALQNQVLLQGDEFVRQIGIDTDSSAVKIAQAQVKVENFTNSFKVLVAEGLVFAIDNINQAGLALTGFVNNMTPINTLALEHKKTFEEYGAALALVGEQASGLSAKQYDMAQGFMATGMSAAEAVARVEALNSVQGGLVDTTVRLTDAGGVLTVTGGAIGEALGLWSESSQMATGASEELVAQALELADQSDYAKERVLELTDAFRESQGTGVEPLTEGLATLAIQLDDDAERLAVHAEMTDLVTSKTIEQIGYIGEDADMLAIQEAALINAAVAQAQLALDSDAARDAGSSHIGIMAGQSEAAYALASAAATAGANLAYMADMAAAAALGAAGAGPKRTRTEIETKRGPRAVVVPRGGGGGGGSRGAGSGGGGGGTSANEKANKLAEKENERHAKEEDKFQQKLADSRDKFAKRYEDLEGKHAAKVKDIWDKYYSDRVAAEAKFNSDKFDQQLGFMDSLASSDEATRQKQLVAEQQAWDESQKIAQTEGAQKASEYYQASLEILKADQDRADAIKELEQGITEATDEETKKRLASQLAYEQELDRRHDQREAERLAAIKTAKDESVTDRDTALQKEDADFSESRQKLVQEFGESIDQLIGKEGELTDAQRSMKDQQIGFANDMVGAYQSAGDAVRTALEGIPTEIVIPVIRTSESGGDPGQPPPDAPQLAGGMNRVPYNRFPAFLDKDERVLTAPQARAMDMMDRTIPLMRSSPSTTPLSTSAPRQSMPTGGSSSSIDQGVTINVQLPNGLAPSPQLAAYVEQAVEKGLRAAGKAKDQQRRMGG